ncbi:MAG: DNA repair exonuclease [Ruminococcaceae bacterium]|nr:DNA repair exonuclease [Oscillospiraceae bacterium]
MLKILHTADLHLDSPFTGLTPEQAARRRAEQRALVQRLGDVAARERVDLVLLAGDLFDSGRIYRDTARELAEDLGRIDAPVFISPGNHDPYDAASPYALPIWPDNVHIFTSAAPAAVELPGLNCVVYGAAFLSERQEESPLTGFHAPEDGRIHLMVLHANTEGAGYAPITAAQIADSGLDYLALGHIHRQSGLQRSGDTRWAYPGCPEGRGFDELGDKGALLVRVDTEGVQAEFVSLCQRRYEILDVDLTGALDPAASVLAVLPAGADRHICRVRLTGRYNLTAAELTAVEQALEERTWAHQVQDRTRPPEDLWARAGEDNLTGLFLQTMATLCEQDPEDEELQLAVRFGLSALEHGEDVAP